MSYNDYHSKSGRYDAPWFDVMAAGVIPSRPVDTSPRVAVSDSVFALFLTVTILMVHVYFCTVDASIGVQVTSETGMVGTETQPSILIQIVQVIIAKFVMDTWQYFVHRYMHINKFLYRHIHSQHHRLVVPYAIGALYNHPLEGLLLDTVGGAISFLISGMTARTPSYSSVLRP
ncbi:sphinganine C4-monooxygenase 1-like protein [Tanacetum coccineum]